MHLTVDYQHSAIMHDYCLRRKILQTHAVHFERCRFYRSDAEHLETYLSAEKVNVCHFCDAKASTILYYFNFLIIENRRSRYVF